MTTIATTDLSWSPDLSWPRDVFARVEVTELVGPAGLRQGLRQLTRAHGALVTELSGPGWSHVLLLEPLAGGDLSVTDLDTGERCRATTRRFVQELGAYVTSTVVVPEAS